MLHDSELAVTLAAAHASGDDSAISQVYRDIADRHCEQGNVDGACFFWTQALVFAMVAGDASAEATLRKSLSQYGRI